MPILFLKVKRQQREAMIQEFQQAFNQTLKTGLPEGMFFHKIIRVSEFSLYFFQKWASIGRLDTLLAKTLFLIHCSESPIFPYNRQDRTLCVAGGHLGCLAWRISVKST